MKNNTNLTKKERMTLMDHLINHVVQIGERKKSEILNIWETDWSDSYGLRDDR